jgi:hypothetical protein
LIFLFALQVYADVPVRKEQVVYTIVAYNGRDYSHTFCREDTDTIYLIADSESFITLRKTFVYFWPLTKQWNMDLETLNVTFNGLIDIKENVRGEFKKIKPVKFTYYNIRDEYEDNWRVAKGEDAYREVERWNAMYQKYLQQVVDYRNKYEKYKKSFYELMQKMEGLRESGEDVMETLSDIESLDEPSEPAIPDYYAVPPASVNEAFIFNLPAGEYFIRFILEDGTVLQGSEKRVVVFEKRRKRGVGFEIIPGDKWTRPVENKIAFSIIYVDGTTDLYLRPFFQDEYNDLYYNKMKRNDGGGNVRMYNWERMQQVPKAKILLMDQRNRKVHRDTPARRDRKEVLLEKPYTAEQVKGASLGYKIVPFDPQGPDENKKPSMRAFRVLLIGARGVVKISVKDKSGIVISSSERQIRIVRQPKIEKTLFIYVILPFVALVIIMTMRAKKFRRKNLII